MKRAFLIHRWDGNPDSDWYNYLTNNLKKSGFEVIIPEMPNSEAPEINSWVSKLKEISQKPGKETYFIGHSVGCQTILRYLQDLPEKIKIGKIVFVAPWFHLQNLENEEAEKIIGPWLETSMDFDRINQHITKITAIFSDNDQWVPVSDKEIFRKIFGAKIIVEHNKGHFTENDGVTEVPKVLEELLNISS